MKVKSVGINATLNVIRQGLSIVFPLITYPYAVRVLGAEGLGKVSYSQSIVSYFALIAALGTSNYVVREASRKKNDEQSLVCIVSEVYSINVLFTIGSYIALIIAAFSIKQLYDYRWLLLLLSANIAFTTFGVDWINVIYEDFLRITIRSIVTYIVSLALLFLLVRTPSDYYQYAMLTVVTTGIICVSNRLYFRRLIKIGLTLHMNIKKHIVPLLTLFVNSIAVTINTNFDTTMLGWIYSDYYVGLYAFSVKVFTVLKSLFCAVFTVAVPKLSGFAEESESKQYKELNTNLCRSILLLVIPASVGLCCLSSQIICILGGNEMILANTALQVLSIALVFAAMNGLIMNAMNISLRREKETLLATAVSAGINIGLNLIFIPLMYHTGAAITTLISEISALVILLMRFKNLNQFMDIAAVRSSVCNGILGSIVVAAECIFVANIVESEFAVLIIAFLLSIVSYTAVLAVRKDAMIQRLVEKLYRKFNVTIFKKNN